MNQTNDIDKKNEIEYIDNQIQDRNNNEIINPFTLNELEETSHRLNERSIEQNESNNIDNINHSENELEGNNRQQFIQDNINNNNTFFNDDLDMIPYEELTDFEDTNDSFTYLNRPIQRLPPDTIQEWEAETQEQEEEADILSEPIQNINLTGRLEDFQSFLLHERNIQNQNLHDLDEHEEVRAIRQELQVAQIERNILHEEWRATRIERVVLREEIEMLQNQQQRTLHGLLRLRLEQFRLRHQQMITLLQFLQQENNRNNEHILLNLNNNNNNDDSINTNRTNESFPDSIDQMRMHLDTVGVDLLQSLNQLTNTANSLEETSRMLEQNNEIINNNHINERMEQNDRNERNERNERSSVLSRTNPLERLVELVRLRSFLNLYNETKSKGATEKQINSLKERIYTDTIKETDQINDINHYKIDNHLICSICRDTFITGSEQITLKCDHWHCKSCLQQWLRINNACPICRTSIDPIHDENLPISTIENESIHINNRMQHSTENTNTLHNYISDTTMDIDMDTNNVVVSIATEK